MEYRIVATWKKSRAEVVFQYLMEKKGGVIWKTGRCIWKGGGLSGKKGDLPGKVGSKCICSKGEVQYIYIVEGEGRSGRHVRKSGK